MPYGNVVVCAVLGLAILPIPIYCLLHPRRWWVLAGAVLGLLAGVVGGGLLAFGFLLVLSVANHDAISQGGMSLCYGVLLIGGGVLGYIGLWTGALMAAARAAALPPPRSARQSSGPSRSPSTTVTVAMVVIAGLTCAALRTWERSTHAGSVQSYAAGGNTKALLAKLQSPKWEVRADAAYTLGHLVRGSGNGIAAALIEATHDRYSTVREQALRALGDMVATRLESYTGPREPIHEALRQSINDRWYGPRAYAAGALAHFGDPADAPLIRPLKKGSEQLERDMALWALGHIEWLERLRRDTPTGGPVPLKVLLCRWGHAYPAAGLEDALRALGCQTGTGTQAPPYQGWPHTTGLAVIHSANDILLARRVAVVVRDTLRREPLVLDQQFYGIECPAGTIILNLSR